MAIATRSYFCGRDALFALVALLLPIAAARHGGAQAQEKSAPPAWLTDHFVARKWQATAAARSFSFLDDGELDVRLVERGGWPYLHLLQPGDILGAGSYLRGSPLKPPRDLVAALSPVALRALQFGFAESGEPIDLHEEMRIDAGDFIIIRTLRRDLGGGGAIAVLTCNEVVVPPHGPTAATFEAEVLALDPMATLLPRLDPGYYDQARGATTGRVRLFSSFHFKHVGGSTFDALRLDRDHLEWSGGLPRSLELAENWRLTIPDGSGTRLLPLPDGELRFPADGPPTPRHLPLASDSRFAIHVDGLGFDRLLRCSVSMHFGSRGLLEFVWSDVKADGITPKVAEAHDVFVLDPQGEPVRGAWVYARSSSTASWPPPALFAVESDADGRARVPVRTGDDPRAVEIVAFEAGERARSGTRIGAQPAEGGGSESIVALEADAACSVAITPPPGRPTWVGLQVDQGAMLVRTASDGTLKLPALARAATLRLGRPWVQQSVPLTLAPSASAPVAVAAKLANGLARRVRVMDERDGVPVENLHLEQVAPPGALYFEHDSVVAPAEFAGQAVHARVVANDFEPFELTIAADAPRDRDLALTRKPPEK